MVAAVYYHYLSLQKTVVGGGDPEEAQQDVQEEALQEPLNDDFDAGNDDFGQEEPVYHPRVAATPPRVHPRAISVATPEEVLGMYNGIHVRTTVIDGEQHTVVTPVRRSRRVKASSGANRRTASTIVERHVVDAIVESCGD